MLLVTNLGCLLCLIGVLYLHNMPVLRWTSLVFVVPQMRWRKPPLCRRALPPSATQSSCAMTVCAAVARSQPCLPVWSLSMQERAPRPWQRVPPLPRNPMLQRNDRPCVVACACSRSHSQPPQSIGESLVLATGPLRCFAPRRSSAMATCVQSRTLIWFSLAASPQRWRNVILDDGILCRSAPAPSRRKAPSRRPPMMRLRTLHCVCRRSLSKALEGTSFLPPGALAAS